MDTVTTIKIEIENMSDEIRIFFIELTDALMRGYNLNFTKNVKIETTEQILADIEAEDFDEREKG